MTGGIADADLDALLFRLNPLLFPAEDDDCDPYPDEEPEAPDANPPDTLCDDAKCCCCLFLPLTQS